MDTRSLRCVALAFGVLCTLSAAQRAQAPAPPNDHAPPRHFGVEERVERRLAQIDVTLTGPPEILPHLKPEQFQLTLGGTMIPLVAADAFCGHQVPSPDGTTPETATGTRAAATYLFYFDIQNMFLLGVHNSIAQARQLIPKLIHDGSRGAIVASGRRTVTFAATTENVGELLAGLARLEADDGLWGGPATGEQTPVRMIGSTRTLSSQATNPRRPALAGKTPACNQARTLQRDAMARAEQALDILSRVLGRFAAVEGPKVAIYFADTLRDQPGRNYLAAVPNCEAFPNPEHLSFLPIEKQAATFGVRIYAVQAAEDSAGKDAQGGLKALGLETGGDAFLNNASPDSIVRRIEDDEACVYVLSFDPAGFPEDKQFAVDVDVDVRGVHVQARSTLVIQSASERRVSTLTAAFTAPDTVGDTVAMRGAIVPLEVRKGRLHVLLQASLPETRNDRGEQWDIGMSVVTGVSIRHEASGSVSVDRAGVRIVLETETTLPKGPYDVALVAAEPATGQIATGRLSGTWEGTFSSGVATPVIMQPTEGAFLRDGKVRKSGSLAVTEDQPLRPDRPAAFVTLVCKAEKLQGSVRVQRRLAGPTASTFPPLDLPFGDAACVQVRDVIPAGSLSSGAYSYEIGVEGRDKEISRPFSVESTK